MWLLIGRFLWNMWQRRQPAFAGGPALRDMGGGGATSMGSSGMGFGMGSGGAPGGKVDITPADYDAFEQLLGEIQSAFSNEDLNGLRA